MATPEQLALQNQISGLNQELVNANQAGYGAGGPFANQQIPTSVLNAPTQPASSATSPMFGTNAGTGQGFNFGNALQTAIDRMNAISPMTTQRQLLVKQLYDQPLTPEELAQLPPEYQQMVNTGNKQELEMGVRLLNDQISNRTGTLDQSVNYLTNLYTQSQQNLETQKNDAINNVLKFVAQYGSQAPVALKSLYGQSYLDSLQAQGIDIKTMASLPTINEQRYISPTSPTLENAIIGQESGGSYTTVNPQSGALGRYQIMPSNLPLIGLDPNNPQDIQTFLNSPPMQDNLYNQIISGLTAKYGGNTDQVIAAYYGGDAAAQVVGTPAGDVKQGTYPSINEYVNQVKARMWNANDATPPPAGQAGNTPSSILGGVTPNFIWQTAQRYALTDPTIQKYVGGLSNTGPASVQKNAIKNEASALIAAAGVDPTALSQEFAANSKAIATQVDFMNTVQRALNGAEQGATLTQQLFASKGINPFDSTWANTTLNDLVKQFGSSGDIKAYQAAMVEIGNEYAQVFARGGQRSVEGNAIAQNIINGNVKLSDIQTSLDTLQAIGNTVINTAVDQVRSIAGGGGTDAVAQFLATVHGLTGTSPTPQSGGSSSGSYQDYLKAIGQ